MMQFVLAGANVQRYNLSWCLEDIGISDVICTGLAQHKSHSIYRNKKEYYFECVRTES